MFCPQCGSANDDSARFCTSCGLDLQQYRQTWQQPGSQVPPRNAPYYSPAPVYQPPTAYAAPPRVPSYLGWAIAVLILCFWPTGIAAVVYASQVSNKLAMGDYAGALESSRKAKMWCWISFGIAIAVWVIAVIALIVAAGTALTTF